MKAKRSITRRAALQNLELVGVAMAGLGAGAAQGADAAAASSSGSSGGADARRAISERVFATSMVDTHEHLIDEGERLQKGLHARVPCDDWALLLSHYLNSDLLAAGMPSRVHERFLSAKVDPLDKWKLLAPYWAAVKNTGYAQAVRIAMQRLYEVDDLSAETVAKVQTGYEKTRRGGFYKRVLQEHANIESCQVNSLSGRPFHESDMPTFLMQDISIVGMFAGPSLSAVRSRQPASKWAICRTGTG